MIVRVLGFRVIPFISGGPLDLFVVRGLYRILRNHGRPRSSAIVGAIRIEIAAWRWSRALQRVEA